MKRVLSLIFMICLLVSPAVFSQEADQPVYLGQWSFSIEGGTVGWLEVKQADGFLDGSLLWKWGSVTPVSNVYFDAGENRLVVTRTQEVVRRKEENGQPARVQVITSILDCKLDGDLISGTFAEPDRTGLKVVKTSFSGRRLPPVPPAPRLERVKYGRPVELFNGRDLTGWTLTDPAQQNGFKVEKGMLVNDPVQPAEGHVSFGNLRTVQEFRDFNLKLEVNIPKGSNSGVYLRGMYEIQVMDSYGKKPDPHNMGALYSRITPSATAEKPAGEWQTLDITLCDRHVTVRLNGTTIINNQPVKGPTGGALQADVFAPGPIYLQGDHGKVLYRNIVLTPIIN